MLGKLLRGTIATLVASTPARALALDEEFKSEFFNFFQLGRSCQPELAGQDRNWHCFRPSGEKFRRLVELAVLADSGGRILRLRLGLDRGFIDHATDGVFARDIAKSFLVWAIPKPVGQEGEGLIDNIADFSSSGARILMREPRRGRQGPDATGGYEVYLGGSPGVAIELPHARVMLTNIEGAFPSSCIFTVDAPAHTVDPFRLRRGMISGWLAIDLIPGGAAGRGWLAARQQSPLPR